MKFLSSLVADVKTGKAKKALVSAAAVLVAIGAIQGVPPNVQAYIGDILGVLASFGVTYAVPNKS